MIPLLLVARCGVQFHLMMMFRTDVDSHRSARIVGEEVGIVVGAIGHCLPSVDVISGVGQTVQYKLAVLVRRGDARLIDQVIWPAIGYGDNDGNAHIYYLDQTNNVIELQLVAQRWVWTAIGKNAGAQAAAGSALTCYAAGGTGAHVYYEALDPRQLDPVRPADHQIIHQLAWTGSSWVDGVP